MGLQFDQRSALLVRFTVAMIVLHFCMNGKIVVVGWEQSSRGSPSGNAFAESDCLVRILAEGVIGLYFFKNDNGVVVTVNDEW